MIQVNYKVVRKSDQWSILRNGEPEGNYVTQEAAFEVAAAHAGGDLRSGYGVSIEAAPPTDPAGAQASGGVPAEGDGFSN